MIRKLIATLRAALLRDRALNHASNGRYEDGLSCLSEIEKLQVRYFEDDLLGGVLANRTGRHQLALALIRRAKDSIETDRRLSEPVKEYFLCFVAYCAEDSLRLMEPSLTITSTSLPDCSQIPLEQVPKRVRRNFPLIWHPDWEHYSK